MQVFDLQPDNNGKRFAEAGAFQDSKFTFEEGPDSSSILLGPNFMKCALYQLSPPEVLSSFLFITRLLHLSSLPTANLWLHLHT